MHSWQNGTRSRDGGKVLWYHSHLQVVWLVFECSISACACFHSENLFANIYIFFFHCRLGLVREKRGGREGRGKMHDLQRLII